MKQTRIRAVLGTLNSKYIHVSPAPYCLLAGIRALAVHRHDGAVVDGTVNEPTEAVAARILARSPTLVALSVYIWNRHETAALISHLRTAEPALFIAVGGPEVEHDAAAFLSECAADAVLLGEGERQIALLCDALAEGRDPSSLAGVVTREGGTPPPLPDPIPPSPILPEYLAAVRGRIAYLETSRGCPFSCAFCLSGGTGVRYFPIERAKAEMLALAGAGARTVKLVDRTFNASAARARELWRFVIAEQGRGIPEGVCFHFEVAGDLLTEEDIALLATAPAGAIRLEIGIQSFHPQTLAAIRRKGDPDRIAKRVRALTALGNLEVHIDLIAGLPHEGLSDFGAGLDRAYRTAPAMLQLGFLKLLHGSALRRTADGFCRFSPTPPYEVLSTHVLGEGELAVLHAAEGALDRLYNSHRFRRTLAYLVDECGQSPFALLSGFGATVPPHGTSLDSYTDAFFAYASRIEGVDPRILRDRMLCDRLATTPDHALPKCLYIPDKKLSEVKKTIQKERSGAGNSIPFAVGILYATGEILVAEYSARHPVTGEYPTSVQKLF